MCRFRRILFLTLNYYFRCLSRVAIAATAPNEAVGIALKVLLDDDFFSVVDKDAFACSHVCYGFNSGQPSAVHVMGRWMSMAAPFCLAL